MMSGMFGGVVYVGSPCSRYLPSKVTFALLFPRDTEEKFKGRVREWLYPEPQGFGCFGNGESAGLILS